MKKLRVLKFVRVILITAITAVSLFSTAPVYAYSVNVSVNLAGGGYTGGTVTGAGFTCGTGGSTCTQPVESGTSVALTASSDSGRTFDTWNSAACTASGGGSSSGNTCTLVAGSNPSGSYVAPRWSFTSYTVSATKTGEGSGTVTGTGTYGNKATATLVATPSAGSVFAGWQTSGDICSLAGKGSGGANPSATCSEVITSWFDNTFNAVAKFDKAPAATSTTPTTPTSTTPKTSTPAATPTTTASEPSASTAVTETKLNGQTLTAQTEPVIEGSSITLTGKATPGATVVLYIHSEPRKETVKADSNGYWTLTVKNLEEGKHTVEAETIDTAGKASERTQIAAFTLKPVLSRTAAATGQAKATNTWLKVSIGAGVGVLVLGAAGGYWFWRRRQTQSMSNNSGDNNSNVV
jgi:hypothetical protein